MTTPKNYRGGNCNPDSVYFSNDIEPILTSNCAISGCHDAKSKEGDVALNNYENIIKTAGITIGNGLKSELIKTMRKTGSNSMPPAGKLTDSDISKVSKWIDQGARNNKCIAGCDSTSYTYSRDITSIINNSCIGCHDAGSTNGVYLNTYTGVKNKVDDGKLWNSINHIGYHPMPSATSKLSDCDINKFKNWIAIGAPEN